MPAFDLMRDRQASHFDNKSPMAPWPYVLRLDGFKFHYIAKDLVLKRVLDKMGLEKNARVLDIGCGSGIWLDRFESTYQTEGFGIDVSRQSLSSAQASALGASKFVVADARNLPFKNRSFTLSVSLDVLEHIEEPERVVDEMIRVAIGNGKILIYAVSKKNMFTYQWFEQKILSIFGIDLHGMACHDPELLIDPEIIATRLKGNGSSLEELIFFHAFFTSIFDRLLLVGHLAFKKLGFFDASDIIQSKVGPVLLGLTSAISRLSLSALVDLDNPWLSRGYANGFIAVARKQTTGD